MTRLLPFLLLCLVLLTTACSKDDPEPEPTLEGTWKLQSSTEYTYDTQGTQTPKVTTPESPGQLLVATGTSVTEPNTNSSATLYPVATYDAAKQLISYPGMLPSKILELTATTLTVSSRRQLLPTYSLSEPPRYAVTDRHYTR